MPRGVYSDPISRGQKISQAQKGRRLSEEWKHNLSLALQGHSVSEGTRRKQSESHKGKPGYWTGKKRVMSLEWRQRIAAAMKGRVLTPEWKRKIGKANSGKDRPQELRERLRIANLGKKLSPEARLRKRRTACRGSRHHSWKGGVTTQHEQIRKSLRYRLWREAVFKRDNYTCQFCGQVRGAINADHIKPFSLFPELRSKVSNGRTLCVECHKKTPSYLNPKMHIGEYVYNFRDYENYQVEEDKEDVFDGHL